MTAFAGLQGLRVWGVGGLGFLSSGLSKFVRFEGSGCN